MIATLRPVLDTGAGQIAKLFYSRNGLEDPARKLAEVQAELARTENQDWPNFMLYGRDTCRRGTP